MKQLFTFLILSIAAVALSSNTFKTLKPFPPIGNSGAPGEQTCILCHTGTPLNGGPGSVSITYNGKRNTYKPNKVYTFTVTTTDATEIHYSFETTALDALDNPAGTPKLIDSLVTLIQTDNRTGRQYVTDYDATPLNVWTFKWKAPATNVGNVSFYLDGVAANGDLKDQGDHVYASDPFVLTYKPSSREEDPDHSIDASVYPDPIQSKAAISYFMLQPSFVIIEIFDVQGKKVKTLLSENEDAGDHELTFDRSFMNNGIYFLQIHVGNEEVTQKVSIQ